MRSDLKEQQVSARVETQYWAWINLVDSSGVNGLMKLWLYQFGILSLIAWSFMIHEFAWSVVEDLCSRTRDVLRRWAGLYRSTDAGCLFRPREKFGLGLTSLVTHFKKLKVIKYHLLKHSPDDG